LERQINNNCHSLEFSQEDRSNSIECIGDNSSTTGLEKKHHLAIRESAKKDCREETIFSQQKKIFLMQSRHYTLTLMEEVERLMQS